MASERKPRKDTGQARKRRKVEAHGNASSVCCVPANALAKEVTSATFVRTGTEVPKEREERVIEALVQAARDVKAAEEMSE